MDQFAGGIEYGVVVVSERKAVADQFGFQIVSIFVSGQSELFFELCPQPFGLVRRIQSGKSFIDDRCGDAFEPERGADLAGAPAAQSDFVAHEGFGVAVVVDESVGEELLQHALPHLISLVSPQKPFSPLSLSTLHFLLQRPHPVFSKKTPLFTLFLHCIIQYTYDNIFRGIRL